jgi:hypothetical protein
MTTLRQAALEVLGQTLDVTLTKHGPTTSLGLWVGGTLAYLAYLLSPALTGFSDLNLSSVQPWHWLALGALIAHIRTVWLYSRRPTTTNRSIAEALRIIESGRFTIEEKRHHYLRLIEAVQRNASC